MTGHKRGRNTPDDTNRQSEKAQLMIYQIRIKGHLDHKWADWFEGFTITPLNNGETLLAGPVLDQAMLHSLLRKVRDANLPLIAISGLEPEQADGSNIKS